jgi:hypothetical protein
VDVSALEAEGQSAIAAAATTAGLEQARVRFLGRKSELKQALRNVRDRDTGQTLNTVREQLERLTAEREAELVAWLSRRLGMKVEAPDLRAAGATLVGGRLLPGATRPAAMLMYKTDDERRVTLYWAPETTRRPGTKILYAQPGGARVFYWIDAECGYAVVSEQLSRQELERIAALAHDQLEK